MNKTVTPPLQQDALANEATEPTQHPVFNAPASGQIDFKWLMAGQGWWVDSARFEVDGVYASELLRLAGKSQSFALRECAATLQAQMRV